MNFEAKLKTITDRYDELSALLETQTDGAQIVKLSKEQSALEDLVQAGRQWYKIIDDMKGAQEIIDDPQADSEMKTLANEEYYELKNKLPEVEQKIKVLLLPKDEADEKNVILEVRAGTGGEEAALFGAELFRMYERYAANKGWKFEVLSLNETGLGGYKEAVAQISGHAVFARLKFESGAHRVQRVPETEAGGRVHTSAATVAVLPEAQEVDVKINEADLEITTCRASGAGGGDCPQAVARWLPRVADGGVRGGGGGHPRVGGGLGLPAPHDRVVTARARAANCWQLITTQKEECYEKDIGTDGSDRFIAIQRPFGRRDRFVIVSI